MENTQARSFDQSQYITEENVKLIVAEYGYASNDTIIENYEVHHASDHMLGFLADYLKLQIHVTANNEKKVLSCFIKAVSRMNAAKAKMVSEMRLFDKEFIFYNVIKKKTEVPGLKPWSAKFIACLDESIVFEDLSALQYKLRSRHVKFDQQHTQQALKTLARFHATTIIFEEKKSKGLQRPYRVNDEYENNLDKGGYTETDPWFVQCRTGAFEAIKVYSKYAKNKELMKTIEERWHETFNSALSLCDASNFKHRSVICHRDLWNNNILFHYKSLEDHSLEPDDCVLVDFQAVRYQPPAGDVMLLLHCNLDSQFRKNNINYFLSFYYDQLETILWDNNINIQDIMTRDKFMASAEEQNKWGLVTHACLVQSFWLEDELMTKTFSDSVKFQHIMNNDKGTFIKLMMHKNDNYKKVVIEVFEEIIEQYCFN